MQGYVESLQFNSSGTWRTDELYFKVKGDMKYLFAIMDDQTRFWIAQQIADHKGTSDVRPMFAQARELAGKEPATVISDGAFNFHTAIKKEYSSLTKHVSEIRIEGKVHNNKMERMNGELRDREKVMRGIKNEESPILKGLQIWHNFARPHQGLGGKTPSEMAGIKVEGENKLLTLIQNASLSSSKQLERKKE
jgi:putative transposase